MGVRCLLLLIWVCFLWFDPTYTCYSANKALASFCGTRILSFSADEGALAGAVNIADIADIDLFLFAFQQNVSDITTVGITVDNFSVTAVPAVSYTHLTLPTTPYV